MISFASDYTTGMHPEILKKMTETNMEFQPGYGKDEYCVRAAEKIGEFCGVCAEDVHFLVGGTQTNQVVISTMLRQYESVIAAKTGHISVHEAGAIEYAGHKVIELDAPAGKLSAESVANYMNAYKTDASRDFLAAPGMVYISFPTEYGTLYSKSELAALSEVCHDNGLLLFVDGARFGYGLAAGTNDLTAKDIAMLCDVFYIGGTKVGAICGEAVIFTKRNTPPCFVSQIKQHGALLAKGRLLGVQFDVLFTDGLYMKISRHAIEMAEKLKKIFADRNYRFFIESPTNQQFVIVDNEKLKRISEKIDFSFWEKYDKTNSVVRFATSWSTTSADLDVLAALL